MGSKRFPNKNFRKFANSNLTEIAILLANKMNLPTYLSTDNIEFKSRNSNLDFTLLNRSHESSSDRATTESVVREAVTQGLIDESCSILLLQPTSPLRTLKSCENILKEYISLKKKSGVCMLSVSEDFSEYWIRDSHRFRALSGVLSNSKVQRRSQDRAPILRENGLYYVFQAKDLFNFEFLTDMKIIPHITPVEEDSDIDTEMDFITTETIYLNRFF